MFLYLFSTKYKKIHLLDWICISLSFTQPFCPEFVCRLTSALYLPSSGNELVPIVIGKVNTWSPWNRYLRISKIYSFSFILTAFSGQPHCGQIAQRSWYLHEPIPLTQGIKKSPKNVFLCNVNSACIYMKIINLT